MYIENLDEIESLLDPIDVLSILIPSVKHQRYTNQVRSRCPVHGGEGDGNFVLNTSTREWCCHSRGCNGRGLVSLYAKSTGMPFKEAIEQLARQFGISVQYHRNNGKSGAFSRSSQSSNSSSPASLNIKPLTIPPKAWQERALEFVQHSHLEALRRPEVMNELRRTRGLTEETIKNFSIGWNDKARYIPITLWGLSSKETNKATIWLPKGFVIPTFFNEQVMRLRIRRVELPPGDKNKYIAVPGNCSTPSFYGKVDGMPIFIIEAEFDAILIQQEAGDLCCCMAIPANHRPDAYADQILRAAPCLIFSLDYEKAVQDRYAVWKNTYPKMKVWMSEKTKSPGDDYKEGVNLREWVKAGLDSEII